MRKNQRAALIMIACLFAVAAIMAAVYYLTRPEAVKGAKTLDIEIVHANGTVKTLSVDTDAEYLRQVLDEQSLIDGSESTYGFMVTTVDGYKADDSKEEWWFFSKSGEGLMTGVDSTPVADGDHFEITLTTGYE